MTADDPQPSPPQRIERPAASLALDRIIANRRPARRSLLYVGGSYQPRGR